MNLNTLGKTGICVSPVTIGAWQLGGPLFFDGKPDGHPDPGKQNVIRMIHELGDLGVNAIDTAITAVKGLTIDGSRTLC